MVSRSALFALALGAAGCRTSSLPLAHRAGSANERLPAIALHHQSSTVDNSPRNLQRGFRVGPTGTIVNQEARDDHLLFSVIDTAGTIIRRIGRIGDGPGEVRDGIIDVSDSDVTVGAITQPRLTRLSLHGDLLASAVTAEPINPKIAISPNEVLSLRDTREGAMPAVVSVADGSVRLLLTRSDSFLRTFPADNMMGNTVKMPVLGLWSGGFIAADGFTYKLALYHWDGSLDRILGRDLPAPHLSEARLDEKVRREIPAVEFHHKAGTADIERVRQRIQAMTRPHFASNRDSFGLDGAGRIWVTGIESDSGFADIFSNTAFLGRVALPCPGFDGGWSVRGSWLVLACASDDPKFEGDAIFKVFRIVER